MFDIRDFAVYLVTDRHQTRGRPLLEVVEAALVGGVRAVQLREKDLDASDLFALATRLRELTAKFDARLLINERIDVALACKADGVHLPSQSFSIDEARSLMGPHAIIGASTHSVEEARRAAAEGADIVLLGPIFDTPSKRPFGPPLGLEALADAAGDRRIPILAIGGITAKNISAVRSAGAVGVAVIRAVLEAHDPTESAAFFCAD